MSGTGSKSSLYLKLNDWHQGRARHSSAQAATSLGLGGEEGGEGAAPGGAVVSVGVVLVTGKVGGVAICERPGVGEQAVPHLLLSVV